MNNNILLPTICASLFIFASCDNSDNFVTESVFSEEMPAAEEDVMSFEEFLKIDSIDYSSWTRSTGSPKTRGISTDLTVHGYTSTSSTGNRKVLISKELASHMGIAKQIYVMETVTAYYNMTISGLSTNAVRFSNTDSPNCGLYPNYTDQDLDDRGYSMSRKGDNVTMATKVVHIISDTSGRSYNQWFPCQPSQLEWIYNIYSATE